MALAMSRTRTKADEQHTALHQLGQFPCVYSFPIPSVRFTTKDSGMLRPYDFLLLGFAISADPTPFILTTYDSFMPRKHVQVLLVSATTVDEPQSCTLIRSSGRRHLGLWVPHVHLHYNHSIPYLDMTA
ncbi:hypothetical protein HBI38_180320 [Parastagonospora nodorum]|nr:hypothetical protein HBH51_175370 [Parastagonospora nodorum]KAH5078271.1 hypothetical protein HBI73_172170 [Parastagonospora nodorum]KAH5291273.1 hypothetical protein HBI11_201660 [Parastagonospora nodorum]KAH5472263.1 hypothetical protein HBI31_191580 [Parastagonospora nodorum]KAH5643334.1 hypothetical protein HBI23_193290 [Parastagonospora nodorum]